LLKKRRKTLGATFFCRTLYMPKAFGAYTRTVVKLCSLTHSLSIANLQAKLTTLNGRTASSAQNYAYLGAHYVNLKEDKPIQTAGHADIRGGSVVEI